jgi:hypothetical protein
MSVKKHYFLVLLIVLTAAGKLRAQQLIHYWNFNTNTTQVTLLTPSQSLVVGASIIHIAGGTSIIDFAGGTGQNFNVANLNARNGDASGTHLRFNNPIGGELVFALPTTGFQDAIVKFTTRRSGSGAGTQYWSYTTDGTTFIPFDTIAPSDGDPALETLDFAAVAATDNNANFKLKVSFAAGSGGTVGNNRFDNFTLDATQLGGQDVTAPVAILDPANLQQNVAVTVNPTITFNEPIRLINNDPINNTNAASLVELRLNDASGTIVPFTTTYSNQVLTLIPNASLSNNQQYYLALLGNVVEDFSNNSIATAQSIQFTTISLQTQFSAGDMAIVAYRMNATATEDEIAILTFKDITPGTFINLTDAKYTTNTVPQCAGGIVWTAPANDCISAGSVIKIQPNALIANRGTVTGSGFGLSSGGDQVIIYTGTASNPNYITALTSNNWVATNTSCSGSNSMIPVGLTDGVSALNTSTAPGNVSGNAVNAYYNGTQTGTAAALRTAILNPANWIAVDGGTTPQSWPTFNFPSPPLVIGATVTSNNTIRLIFNNDLNATSATNVSNYTGITGLSTAAVTSNGTAADTVTLTFAAPFTSAATYNLTVSSVADAANVPMACAYHFNFTYNTQISLASNFIVTEENAGTYNLNINITNPTAATVDLVVLTAPYSTANASDFTLASQTLTLTGSSNIVSLAIPIIDDASPEQTAEYFTIALRNPVGCSITGDTMATIYIRDNDRVAPVPTQDVELQYVGSFDPSGNNNSTCEVVVYDSMSKRLLTSSAITGKLDIIDFNNPLLPVVVQSIDITPYGGITSVTVHKSIIAVASPNANEQLDGSVLFFDMNGTLLKQVTVGALPDMITFTADGTKVLTANEGQPSTDYTVDPEGSVSIIDLSGGISGLTQGNVTTLDFTAFNAQEATLIASGVRKTKLTSTLSQDLEPEYIGIHKNGLKAWVTLQENNAIAEIDLQTKVITGIWALGTKNFNATGKGFDASDNNNEILIANWPVKSFYIPDALATYSVGNTNYLVTANEGDEKEYNTLEERVAVSDASYVLDAAAFPNAAWLKKSYNLGRMRVTNLNGDTDGDGDFDEIYCVGSRSFSIFNADTKALVYDSGDDFELFTSKAPSIAPLFNSDHEGNARKSRSRAKGPEPEGVTIATISEKQYAFVSLERVGGVMVYDVTDPANARFVDYKNSRSVSAYTGDHGPEGLIYIPAAATATAKNYVVVANEISGTLSIFEVKDNNEEPNGISTPDHKKITFNLFPNPANQLVYFNRIADVEVVDVLGKVVYKGAKQLTLKVDKYPSGVYFVHTSDGAVARLVVKH